MSAVGRTAALLGALGLVLFLLGCAAPGNSRDDRQRGFYGGVTIGGSRIN